MPVAKVNGVEVEFEPGMTVLQVAELAGEEIPRFCYHERLSIAGNCRMCLVEVKPGPPKPQASCALPAAENQEIFTNTPMVKKAREGVMEFLLINHPLDCPICDQGGECDLQDQAMGYGRDDSRYDENKRAVEEKEMGPLIKTVMTRCIQCTRCVRFITEVAGVPDIGLISRGEDVEITTYLGKAVGSELSGNVNDLCPVGALTHKPWAFNYRPWELKKTQSIDVMDALGSGPRESWLFNSTLAGIEQADVVLIIGANPRTEAPVFNARLRKQWLAGKMRIGVIGENADLTYDYDYLGAGPATLKTLAKSKASFLDALKGAQRPAIIVGQGALTGESGAANLKAIAGLAKTYGVIRDGWNGWNVLHSAAARVGGLDLGFVPGEGGLTALEMVKPGALDVLFLLGADEIEASASGAFTVYMGSHGDRGAHKADVILPGAAYTEKNGLYVNTEGRVQMGERAVFPKGEAREDWAILRALSERLDAKLPYDSLDQLRLKLFSDHPTFGQIDFAPGSVATSFDLSGLGGAGELGDQPFRSAVEAFHLTNPIARASVTMAECAALASGAAKMAAE